MPFQIADTGRDLRSDAADDSVRVVELTAVHRILACRSDSTVRNVLDLVVVGVDAVLVNVALLADVERLAIDVAVHRGVARDVRIATDRQVLRYVDVITEICDAFGKEFPVKDHIAVGVGVATDAYITADSRIALGYQRSSGRDSGNIDVLAERRITGDSQTFLDGCATVNERIPVRLGITFDVKVFIDSFRAMDGDIFIKGGILREFCFPFDGHFVIGIISERRAAVDRQIAADCGAAVHLRIAVNDGVPVCLGISFDMEIFIDDFGTMNGNVLVKRCIFGELCLALDG